MKKLYAFALIAAAFRPDLANADEILTYTYDARGRIIKIEHTGSINNGVKTEYVIDKAENRSTVIVTGASS